MRSRLLYALIVVCFVSIFAIDVLTVRGIADGVFYIIPIALAAGLPGSRAVYAVALPACLFNVLGHFVSGAAGAAAFPVWNRLISLSAIVVTTVAVLAAKRWERRLYDGVHQQRVVAELGKRALAAASFQNLLDTANEAIAVHFGIRYCKVLRYVREENKVVLISGYGWDDLVGKWEEVSDPGTMSGFLISSGRALVSKDLTREARFRVPDVLREKGIVSCINVPIPGPSGTLFGILEADAGRRYRFDEEDVFFLQGVANLIGDAVRRVEVEEELRRQADALTRSNRALNEFAAVASHDLQEPLRKIFSFSERLASHPDCGGEKPQEYVAKVKDAAERMRNLISDLLLFSRLKEGHAPARGEEVSLKDVVGEALSDLEVRIAQKKAVVRSGDLPVVRANRFQMHQLFSNLISNAIKYCCADGPPRVEIQARPVPEGVEIAVKDNGIGFDPAAAENIFQPFKRLHARGTYEGTGMGLAISRKIVEQHGGRIRAESAPGKGSTFLIFLPRETLVS